MVKKTTQWPLVIALCLGAASRRLFFPDAAGVLSISLTVFMGIAYLAAFYVPWKTHVQARRVIRDIVIAIGFNMGANLIAGLVSGSTINYKLGIPIMFATVLLVAILNRARLLPEVVYICLSIWALGVINVPFMSYNWLAWMFGFFYVWYCMWLAVGIVRGVTKLISPQPISDHLQPPSLSFQPFAADKARDKACDKDFGPSTLNPEP